MNKKIFLVLFMIFVFGEMALATKLLRATTLPRATTQMLKTADRAGKVTLSTAIYSKDRTRLATEDEYHQNLLDIQKQILEKRATEDAIIPITPTLQETFEVPQQPVQQEEEADTAYANTNISESPTVESLKTKRPRGNAVLSKKSTQLFNGIKSLFSTKEVKNQPTKDLDPGDAVGEKFKPDMNFVHPRNLYIETRGL